LIPDHFDTASLEGTPFDMYLCGPPPMVDAIKNWLAGRGIQNFRLHYEKFSDSNTVR
ncbi:MAG: hypothetical protein JO270_23095, partial [Acidobacteriaceae bacterium]|nr:hypothetical protein [Acidobacteriaceae bacterium]